MRRPGAGLRRVLDQRRIDFDLSVESTSTWPAEDVDQFRSEREHLAEAQAAIGTENHEPAVGGVDRIREGHDFIRYEKSHLFALDAGKFKAIGRIAAEPSVVDGCSQCLAHDLCVYRCTVDGASPAARRSPIHARNVARSILMSCRSPSAGSMRVAASTTRHARQVQALRCTVDGHHCSHQARSVIRTP